MLISKMLTGVISLIFVSIYSHVAISSTGGFIHFRGAVFEPPCVIKPQEVHINLTCVRQQVVNNHKLTLDKIGKGHLRLNNLAYVKLSQKNHTSIVNMDIVYR